MAAAYAPSLRLRLVPTQVVPPGARGFGGRLRAPPPATPTPVTPAFQRVHSFYHDHTRLPLRATASRATPRSPTEFPASFLQSAYMPNRYPRKSQQIGRASSRDSLYIS